MPNPVDFLHDFVHIFWPSVRAVGVGEAPVEGYLSGPFLLVELWFFGLFPLSFAKWLWFFSSLLELAALAFFGAQLLSAREPHRPDEARAAQLARRVLGVLLLTSVPILDSLLYGQLGIMAALGITIALWSLTDEDATKREQDLMAGIFLGIAVAAKPSWMLFLLLLPALRRWRAAAFAALSLGIAHASAFLVFGGSSAWQVTVLCYERGLALRETIMNAPDSQHVAHVAQRWMHALFGSVEGSAATRLAWLSPTSTALGIAILVVLLVRGARGWRGATLAIVAAKACLVPTSWPLDFCLLPLLIASALPARATPLALALPALAGLLISVVLRAVPGLRSDTAGACLAATAVLALHASLTRTGPHPSRRATPKPRPAGV